MNAPSPISPVGTKANGLDEIELVVRAGAARALRKRAAVQRQLAADGTSSAGEKCAGVIIRTGEAAVAARLTTMFEQIAADIEAGVPQ
jgi:hypothetical protein